MQSRVIVESLRKRVRDFPPCLRRNLKFARFRLQIYSHDISSHTSIVYFSSYLEQKTLAPLHRMCTSSKKSKNWFLNASHFSRRVLLVISPSFHAHLLRLFVLYSHGFFRFFFSHCFIGRLFCVPQTRVTLWFHRSKSSLEFTPNILFFAWNCRSDFLTSWNFSSLLNAHSTDGNEAIKQ